jgi:hypothetical protein
MYGTPSQLVIGFHSCDATVGEQILDGETELSPSKNDYDWLGSGRYFWEGNLARAREYARWLFIRTSPPCIAKPFVVGAVIDLGLCLNLLESENLDLLKNGYEQLLQAYRELKNEMPQNKPLRGGKDLLLRNLDRAVIETVHELGDEAGKPPFDSVRGVFWEGRELYPHAGFRSHNHIQICVRNPNCIKGFFRPKKPSSKYRLPSKLLDSL